MNNKALNLVSLVGVVATAMIISGCGGALPTQTTTSTAATGNTFNALFPNLSTDPMQACRQQGGQIEVSQNGTGIQRCVLEVYGGNRNMGTIGNGSLYNAYRIQLIGTEVPVVMGSSTSMNQYFSPIAVFPKDTLISYVGGSWGTPTTKSWSPKILGKKRKIFSHTTNNCNSVNLSGQSKRGKSVIVGSDEQPAGLVGVVSNANGDLKEKFLVSSQRRKEFSEQGSLMVGLNVAADENNAYWQQDLCMNLQVQRFQVVRCVNQSNQPIACPQF